MSLLRKFSKLDIQTYRDKDFFTLLGTKSLSVENQFDHDTYTTGTASVNYLASENKFELSVGVGEVAIHQTNINAPYFEGKVQKVELTQEDFQPVVGLQKGYGYVDFADNDPANFFSNQDGIFLLSEGSTVTLKTYREGTELNSLDITSIMTNGWDKFGVVDMYFLWLGGAIQNVFLVTPDGKFEQIPDYTHVGQTDLIFRNPQKPITAFLNSTSAAGSMKQVCGMVGTENRAENINNILPFEAELRSVGTTTQFYHFATLRYKKSLGRGLYSILDSLSFYTNTSNDAGRLYLTENTTVALTDGFTDIVADGVAEVDYTQVDTATKSDMGRIVDIFAISLNGDSQLKGVGHSKAHILKQSLDLSGVNENKTLSIFYSPDSGGQNLGIVGKLRQYN